MTDFFMPPITPRPLAAPIMNAKAQEMQKIEAAAEEFEAVFVAEMLRPMFEGIQSDEMFGGGHAEDTWRGLLIDEYGKGIARAGGIGLADHIKAAMIEMQSQQ